MWHSLLSLCLSCAVWDLCTPARGSTPLSPRTAPTGITQPLRHFYRHQNFKYHACMEKVSCTRTLTTLPTLFLRLLFKQAARGNSHLGYLSLRRKGERYRSSISICLASSEACLCAAAHAAARAATYLLLLILPTFVVLLFCSLFILRESVLKFCTRTHCTRTVWFFRCSQPAFLPT